MSKDTINDYGKSIRSKLLNVAKDKNIFYQTVLTCYFQERLLYRISQTCYRNNFYLKGGSLMWRILFSRISQSSKNAIPHAIIYDFSSNH